LPPINELKPPYQSNNNGIRADPEKRQKGVADQGSILAGEG